MRAAGFFADSLVDQIKKAITEAKVETPEHVREVARARHVLDLAEDIAAILRDARREPVIVDREVFIVAPDKSK